MEKMKSRRNLNFKNWVWHIIFDKSQAIWHGECQLDPKNQKFLITVGLVPDADRGIPFSKSDTPLMLEHEIAHALNLIEGIDDLYEEHEEENSLPYALARTFFESRKLVSEKKAWRRTIENLPFVEHWTEIAQFCLNQDLFDFINFKDVAEMITGALC